MTPSTARPAYFHATDAGFVPTAAARSPWDPAMLSGVALAGLQAHLVEQALGDASLSVARLTIDILGTAPRSLTTGRVIVRRDGARLRLLEAELLNGDRVVARASALLVRIAETPEVPGTRTWPAPETIGESSPSSNPELRDAIERRIVHGSVRDPGPGAMWVRIDAEMVAGVPLSPLVRAAMFADFGSSIGGSIDVRQWTYANVDIAVHFSRMPRGEWLLIEAECESDGNGVAIIGNVFADRDGIYGRGHQTLFVDRRR